MANTPNYNNNSNPENNDDVLIELFRSENILPFARASGSQNSVINVRVLNKMLS